MNLGASFSGVKVEQTENKTFLVGMDSMHPIAAAPASTSLKDGDDGHKVKHVSCFHSSCCTRFLDGVKRFLPILTWLPRYKARYLYPDIISGVSVGLMAIPQCLAYGDLAGLSPVAGLRAGMMSPFLYCFFGGSKDLSISPVSIVSVIVAQYTLSTEEYENEIYASSLACLAGCIMIILGVMNLGILMSFCSVPVLSGYVSCIGISVIFVMMKTLFGLKFPRGTIWESVVQFFRHIAETRAPDVSLGVTCLLIFFLLKKLASWNSKRKITDESSFKERVTFKVVWIICSARFTVLIMVSIFLSQFLAETLETNPFTTVGKMDNGFPKPDLPLRSFTTRQNDTVSLLELTSKIWTGGVTVALVALLNTVMALKTVANLNNYRVDISQEIVALGLITLISSFFRGFSVAGSLSRSLLNSQCGVRTPLGGIFAGLVLVFSVSILTPWFQYIPRAALAALVISALIPLIDIRTVKVLWNAQRAELIPFCVTFLLVLYSPVIGIGVGAAVHLIFFTYFNAVLNTNIEPCDTKIVITPKIQSLLYPSAEQLVDNVEKQFTGDNKNLIIDLRYVNRIDATVAMALCKLTNSIKKKATGVTGGIFLSNVSQSVFVVLEKVNFDVTLIKSHNGTDSSVHEGPIGGTTSYI